MIDQLDLHNQTSILDYNNTDNYTTRNITDEEFFKLISIIIPIVFAFIAILGLFGNVLVIIVIAINKHMRNSTNLLLLNMAIADLSFVLLCVPFTAYRYSAQGQWIFGDVWCKFVNYVIYVCAWASVYTLVLMCLDRLFAVVFAIQLPNIRSKRNVNIAISLLWIIVLLVNIPALVIHGETKYVEGETQSRICGFLSTVDDKTKEIFQFCFFVFGFALPVLVISVLYTILIRFITQKTGPNGNKDKGLNKTKKRVTIVVILVVSAFIICWLPIQIMLVLFQLKIFHPTNIPNVAAQIAANCLAYMNSCINPVLYALVSSSFRTAFIDFLCCKVSKRNKANRLHSKHSQHNPAINNADEKVGLSKQTVYEPLTMNGDGAEHILLMDRSNGHTANTMT